jgi:hypothetical protein
MYRKASLLTGYVPKQIRNSGMFSEKKESLCGILSFFFKPQAVLFLAGLQRVHQLTKHSIIHVLEQLGSFYS